MKSLDSLGGCMYRDSSHWRAPNCGEPVTHVEAMGYSWRFLCKRCAKKAAWGKNVIEKGFTMKGKFYLRNREGLEITKAAMYAERSSLEDQREVIDNRLATLNTTIEEVEGALAKCGPRERRR